jgi:hypothetical protein
MERRIRILHIDPGYEVTYMVIFGEVCIRSSLTLDKTLKVLKENDFDLIYSEPQQMVILGPTTRQNHQAA